MWHWLQFFMLNKWTINGYTLFYSHHYQFGSITKYFFSLVLLHRFFTSLFTIKYYYFPDINRKLPSCSCLFFLNDNNRNVCNQIVLYCDCTAKFPAASERGCCSSWTRGCKVAHWARMDMSWKICMVGRLYKALVSVGLSQEYIFLQALVLNNCLKLIFFICFPLWM